MKRLVKFIFYTIYMGINIMILILDLNYYEKKIDLFSGFLHIAVVFLGIMISDFLIDRLF